MSMCIFVFFWNHMFCLTFKYRTPPYIFVPSLSSINRYFNSAFWFLSHLFSKVLRREYTLFKFEFCFVQLFAIAMFFYSGFTLSTTHYRWLLRVFSGIRNNFWKGFFKSYIIRSVLKKQIKNVHYVYKSLKKILTFLYCNVYAFKVNFKLFMCLFSFSFRPWTKRTLWSCKDHPEGLPFL